jgi:hypothetical protein
MLNNNEVWGNYIPLANACRGDVDIQFWVATDDELVALDVHLI